MNTLQRSLGIVKWVLLTLFVGLLAFTAVGITALEGLEGLGIFVGILMFFGIIIITLIMLFGPFSIVIVFSLTAVLVIIVGPSPALIYGGIILVIVTAIVSFLVE